MTKDNTVIPINLVTRVPLSDGLPFYNYGTAGFRFKAEYMDGLMVRVGMLGTMLLLLDQEDPPSTGNSSSVHTGVMITASHNDESYNGVKLANPDGSMLTPSQEEFLTKWVNERDLSKFQAFLETKAKEIVRKFTEVSDRPLSEPFTCDEKSEPFATNNIEFVFHIGRDTRAHSEKLSDLLVEGAWAFIACVASVVATLGYDTRVPFAIRDHGVLTTPMLHHIVLHSNPHHLPSYIEPKTTRKGYIETYAKAYVDLLEGLAASSSTAISSAAPPQSLRIDGACGVGYEAALELFDEIKTLAESSSRDANPTNVWVSNGPGDGPLNDSCGSEHVQKQLQPPTWYPSSKSDNTTESATSCHSRPYCCSLDGDADRIVFFGQGSANELAQLLDGDKIAILIAHVLQTKFKAAIAADASAKALPEIQVGIVQTAYANGASMKYVKETLQIPTVLAKTGVKHLHHAAVENFDVGIYFEANGHGTVVFSKTYQEFAQTCWDNYGNPFFVQLHRLINPAVGDALSDLLLVDYLLRSLNGWTLEDWNTKLYDDLPSRMLKVKVADRTIIKCNANESVCLEPPTVQPLLETAMNSVDSGRTFVRPSGTEDVVRVYAEASTREKADSLAQEAAKIVHDTCAGVGDRP